MAVRLRENVAISKAQIPPLRGVRGVFIVDQSSPPLKGRIRIIDISIFPFSLSKYKR